MADVAVRIGVRVGVTLEVRVGISGQCGGAVPFGVGVPPADNLHVLSSSRLSSTHSSLSTEMPCGRDLVSLRNVSVWPAPRPRTRQRAVPIALTENHPAAALPLFPMVRRIVRLARRPRVVRVRRHHVVAFVGLGHLVVRVQY